MRRPGFNNGRLFSNIINVSLNILEGEFETCPCWWISAPFNVFSDPLLMYERVIQNVNFIFSSSSNRGLVIGLLFNSLRLSDPWMLPWPFKIEKRSFDLQTELPNLPVPDLNETFETYLDHLVPLVSKEEHGEAADLVKQFLQDLGPRLQERLRQRYLTTDNWVSTCKEKSTMSFRFRWIWTS